MEAQVDLENVCALRSLQQTSDGLDNLSLSHVSIEKEGQVNAVQSLQNRSVAERRLLRKLDMRFMPTIVLIYIMNYIDRTAITAARLKGLERDLGLSDTQYDTAIAILYVTYCTFQLPSNMIINQVPRPSLYTGLCVMAWGATSAMTGITHSFAGILACRLFIGFPEAVFYPGMLYLASRWYTRKELAFRGAIRILAQLSQMRSAA
ncbi:hypothetical protein ACEPAG_3261 [Sanghuangporus baumii]